ncbi:MAG: hypothetical protein ACFFDF_16820 [Candidatus Odinarchaeota archaeon]
MSKNRKDKIKEPTFLDFLSAYLKPTDWKRTAFVIIIVATVLLLIFAFTPLIWDVIFDLSTRIAPNERLHNIIMLEQLLF